MINQNVSLFENAFQHIPIGQISIKDYFYGIIQGKWQDEVLNYRKAKLNKSFSSDEIYKLKLKLRAVSGSGLFDYGSDDRLINHSGLIVIDIDKKDQDQNIKKILESLKKIPSLFAIHYSVGGEGLAAYFKIRKDKHAESFETLQKILANDYGIVVDSNCRNVSRLRFVSYDPNCYINEGAIILRDLIKKQDIIKENQFYNFIYSGRDIDFIIEQIRNRKICICPDYDSWLKCAFALSSEYGEAGRDYFRLISLYWHGDKEKIQADKQYDRCLKRNKSGITIKTFFWLAKQAGCNIVSDRTKKIKAVASIRRKDSENLKNGKLSAKIYLKEIENIEGNDVDEIIDSVWELPKSELNNKDERIIDNLKTYLKSTYKLKFNEITRKVEVDNIELDDRLFNTIRIRALDSVSDKVSRDLLETLITSEFVPKYNPLHDFFNKNKHLKSSGNIEKLAKCIDSPILKEDSGYIEYFLERWLLSIISSCFGTHSILILVITGKQGINKTKFFRELLPEELRGYYTESKLDEGNDAYILMTKKLLIIDDEFGGKTKKEAEKLKEISSRDTFSIRAPYGRFSEDLKRLAVLGGTSNNDEILNDPTGNRRIIPIKANNIDFQLYEQIDKKELFIELYHKWKSIGDKWFLEKEDIERLNRLTEYAEQSTPESELVLKYFEICDNMNILGKFRTASEMRSYIEQSSSIRLSHTKFILWLNRLGFIRDKKKINGKTIRGYYSIKKIDKNNTDNETNTINYEEKVEKLPF